VLRIRDVYPDFYPSRITAIKERGEKKKLVAIPFLPKKLSLSSQKYGFGIRDPRSGIRDPGSEIRDPEKTYSGSRGQKRPRSRNRNTRGKKYLRISNTADHNSSYEFLPKIKRQAFWTIMFFVLISTFNN
jgi:hypothetical protein